MGAIRERISLGSLIVAFQSVGEHTFLYGMTYYGTSYTNVPVSATTYRGKMTFDAETGVLSDIVFYNGISSTGTLTEQAMVAEIGKTTFNDYLKSDLVSGMNWEYFYAIRPCKVLGS